jgi:hypothetical protein
LDERAERAHEVREVPSLKKCCLELEHEHCQSVYTGTQFSFSNFNSKTRRRTAIYDRRVIIVFLLVYLLIDLGHEIDVS